MRRFPTAVLLAAVMALAPVSLDGCASRAPVGQDRGASVVELTPDGAWSWFSEPRAFCVGETLVAGWVTSAGRLQAGTCDLGTHRVSVFDVVPEFDGDDHSHPVLVRTSDGRYSAFYSIHAGASTYLKYRVTARPFDLSSWYGEREIATNTPGFGGATYPNPVPLSGAVDTLLVFWRGGNWNPTCVRVSYDPLWTDWQFGDAEALVLRPSERPYAKYAVDGTGRVGIAFTDGHPRETKNNLYFIAADPRDVSGTSLRGADGRKLGSPADLPLTAADADLVFDRTSATEETGDNCWIWDVAFDASDNAVVAYSTFVSRGEHQYHVARHDGVRWEDQLLVGAAGGSIADTTRGYHEYYYSGGMALDPADPGTVYMSLPNAAGGWDIAQWKTADGGRSWAATAVTSGATEKNVRPVVPRDHPPGLDIVLWMSGRYEHYTDYETAVRLWMRPSSGTR
ncbi:MAG: BNR-4 repeat-containing protein [Candidatus Eisenbacteria bacterium]